MKEYFILINTGSRANEPCKAFLVSVCKKEIGYVVDETEQILIDYSGMPQDSYQSKGEFIAQRIIESLEANGTEISVHFVFFRCPALRRNIIDLYTMSERMVIALTPEDGKLASGLKISHGSEIAFWIAYGLFNRLGCIAVSSCGIPTDKLPKEAKFTGIPGVELESLSHWESVAGLAAMISQRDEIAIGDVKFILIMLGSGFGVYGWMQDRIVSINVRHMNGAMSQSSIGATVDYLTLLDYFKEQGITDIDQAIKFAAGLSGKNGGLSMYDSRYGDLKNFASDVREAIANPTCSNYWIIELFKALVLQLVQSAGRARMAMSYLGEIDTQVPVYFFGGGANWSELTANIQEFLGTKLFSGFERIVDPNQDPEMSFFLAEALMYLNGAKAMPY